MIQIIIVIVFALAVIFDIIPKIKKGNNKKVTIFSIAILSLSFVLIIIYSIDETFFQPLHELYVFLKHCFA